MGFLVEDLIKSIKLRTFAPISQKTLEEADLLQMANEELLTKITSDISSAREDFFLVKKRVPVISLKENYGIPERAIGNALKAIFFEDQAGNLTPLDRSDVDQAHLFSNQTGQPQKFYFEGDEVIVLPKPAVSGGSIVFSFAKEPSHLVLSSSVGKISNIAVSVSTVTFTISSDLTTYILPGDKVDFISHKSPYLTWADDVTVLNVTSTTVEVSRAEVESSIGSIDISNRDYLALSGESNVPMVPNVFHPVLAQTVACRILQSLGHADKYQIAKAELEQLRVEALKVIKNRIESSPERVRTTW